MTDVDLPALLGSWELHLRAERKSPETLKAYTTGVRLYLAWCERTDRPVVLDRNAVRAWVADLLDQGAEAATARSRQLAVRRFSAWCADENEIPADPLLGLKPPKLDAKVVPVLADEELARLIKVCADDKTFRGRRDEALVRLMAETAMRADDALSIQLPDLNLAAGEVVIRSSKGGKGRRVGFSARTGTAVDRYMRLRRAHRLASSPALWVGDRGKGFGYAALWAALKMRAALAGLEHFHPHQLRHTGASRWLEAGGSEGGLMAMAGWSRRDMIDRYTKSTSERRAIDEGRRLGLGDRL